MRPHDLKVGDEIQFDNSIYEWKVAFIEGDDIRLESDRLDDIQPYWIWITFEYLETEGYEVINHV